VAPVRSQWPHLCKLVHVFCSVLFTPSTTPIFEVRLNQNFVENLPRKNTTITTFHAVSKKGTGLFTDLPNFCYRDCFFFQVIQTFTQMSVETCQEGLFTCKIAKRPGINTRMCLYINTRSLAHRLCSFTHAQARHVFRRAQIRSPAGRECTPTTRPLSGDFAAFLVLACKRISFFTDMRMLPALASPILLLGRSDASRPHVHRGDRNWLVAQDLIGACHIHTCVHKKIPRHMKLRAYTRDRLLPSLCLLCTPEKALLSGEKRFFGLVATESRYEFCSLSRP
jgi:hypothetical protein